MKDRLTQGYGGAVWFFLYTSVILYKIEKIYGKIDFSTAFFDLLGAVIFGVFMAWGLSQIMQFRVVLPLACKDQSCIPESLYPFVPFPEFLAKVHRDMVMVVQ